MIVKENIEIGGRVFTKQYSDGSFYIERDGVKYSEAIDPADIPRTYTETDIPVEAEATTETDIPVEAEATTETDIPVEADSNPEPDLTVSDTLEMLSEMGVDTDD